MPTTQRRRVLITGGAGFIGSRLVRTLAAAGLEVCVFDNLSSGLPMPVGEAMTAVVGDIRDEAVLDATVKTFRPTHIVHLAAVHHIPTCETERAYSLDVNVVGTEPVLASAEHHGVAHIVLASSGAVYESVDGRLNEALTPRGALANYALAKVTNEQQISFWATRTGGVVTLARIFNTIGPDDPNARLITDILDQIQMPGANTVQLGNTSPRRDYVWVEDVAHALHAALRRQAGVPGSVTAVNVCSEMEYSVAEIVQILNELLGRSLTVEVDATRVRRVDRPHQLVRSGLRTGADRLERDDYPP